LSNAEYNHGGNAQKVGDFNVVISYCNVSTLFLNLYKMDSAVTDDLFEQRLITLCLKKLSPV